MPQAIYDYHYGMEAEQYAFFRIPKVLMTEPHFMLRCSPTKGDYQFYMYCYQRENFEKARSQPEKGSQSFNKKRSEPER